MISIPVGIAGRSALGFGRQLVGQSSSMVFSEIQEKTAEQVFKVLGELKGGAMKFGQALSVFEAALPEESDRAVGSRQRVVGDFGRDLPKPGLRR